MRTVNVSNFARPLIRVIILIFILGSLIYSQDLTIPRHQSINSQFGAGIEFAKNSELGIFGQYNFNDNISFIGKTRYCGHDENIYISTGIIYYLQKGVNL